MIIISITAKATPAYLFECEFFLRGSYYTLKVLLLSKLRFNIICKSPFDTPLFEKNNQTYVNSAQLMFEEKRF